MEGAVAGGVATDRHGIGEQEQLSGDSERDRPVLPLRGVNTGAIAVVLLLAGRVHHPEAGRRLEVTAGLIHHGTQDVLQAKPGIGDTGDLVHQVESSPLFVFPASPEGDQSAEEEENEQSHLKDRAFSGPACQAPADNYQVEEESR